MCPVDNWQVPTGEVLLEESRASKKAAVYEIFPWDMRGICLACLWDITRKFSTQVGTDMRGRPWSGPGQGRVKTLPTLPAHVALQASLTNSSPVVTRLADAIHFSCYEESCLTPSSTLLAVYVPHDRGSQKGLAAQICLFSPFHKENRAHYLG